jgi:barstar (barnase inhibitor)
MKVQIDLSNVDDDQAFHLVWAKALGFPSWYGKNWDAWIDCMSALRSGDTGVEVQIARDEVLEIEIRGTEALAARTPKIVCNLVDCASVVNRRYMRIGERPPVLLLPC